MIGNIKYEDLLKLTTILENSNTNVKSVINLYKENSPNGTIKMERFTSELDGYINYLKNLYQINRDADEALVNLKELNK